MKKTAIAWYKTRPALALESVIAMLLAYGLGSVSIDTASLWAYAGTFLALSVSVWLFVACIRGRV